MVKWPYTYILIPMWSRKIRIFAYCKGLKNINNVNQHPMKEPEGRTR